MLLTTNLSPRDTQAMRFMMALLFLASDKVVAKMSVPLMALSRLLDRNEASENNENVSSSAEMY